MAVAGSQVAAAALARNHLSLDQAVVIAEFDHVAQRARDARTEQAATARLTAQLAQAGVRIVDRPDRAGRRGPVRPLSELRGTAQTEPGTPLSETDHAACPGHVVWLEPSWRREEPVVAVFGCDGWQRYGHAERYANSA